MVIYSTKILTPSAEILDEANFDFFHWYNEQTN